MLRAAAIAAAVAIAASPRAHGSEVAGPPGADAHRPPAAALDESLSGFTSNLPVLVVDTLGARTSSERPAPAIVAVWMPGDGARARLAASPDLRARAEVRLRGASSLRHPKKQLVLRFTGDGGADAATPFLGMPAGARFVLRPSYVDKSLLRDALASALARDMGMPAPRARHVEVFLVSSGDRPNRAHYHGVYVAMENVEVGPGRVEIDPLGPADVAEPAISGGYLLRRDRPSPGDTVVRTRRGEALVLQDPPPGRARPEQAAWIAAWLDRLEALLFSADAGERLAARALVDLPSFVDLGILVEATKNADGLETSTFFAKPRGAPLRAGPPWDFDVAMRNDRIAVDPTGWQVLRPREGRSPWWPQLARDPDVAQSLADRWAALRAGPLADAAVLARVRALAAGVAEAADRNFERWPVLGRQIGPNPDAPATWREEVANLEAWLLLRLHWLDAQWPAPPRVERDAEGGRVVLAEEGEPFAAESDPRGAGGAPARGATRLDGTPPRRTSVAERRGRSAACGSKATVPLLVPDGADEIVVETAAPPEAGFVLALDGGAVAAVPPLPIVRPLTELGSAMRADGLHLSFRAAPPASSHGSALTITATGGPRCALPALRISAVRLGRYPLPGEVEAVVRLRRGDAWSAPAQPWPAATSAPPRTPAAAPTR